MFTKEKKVFTTKHGRGCSTNTSMGAQNELIKSIKDTFLLGIWEYGSVCVPFFDQMVTMGQLEPLLSL